MIIIFAATKHWHNMIVNPFILYGYESEKYFCDRKAETEELKRQVVNGNNVALIAPRRIGKTGLIEHLFHQKEIRKSYYTFLIDIYATKNMEEFTLALSTSMLNALRPYGKKVMQQFVGFLKSLHTSISFDMTGMPLRTFCEPTNSHTSLRFSNCLRNRKSFLLPSARKERLRN